MRDTKNTLIENSLKLIRDNLTHTFFAVTIRPNESFLRKFPFHIRTSIVEEILQNLIAKYDAHLISYPHKPKNHHLKIISHNAIETKTRFGSPDLPHSHGIWGINDTLLEKWNSQDLHDGILQLGFFKYENQNYPLRRVIQSIKQVTFTSNLIEKTTPEGWLDYAYKWCDDPDPLTEWSFIHSPFTNNQKTIKEMWDEPHTEDKNFHKGLRREDPLSTRTLPTILGTLQTKTYQGIHQRK
jgi:hypothetical protein